MVQQDGGNASVYAEIVQRTHFFDPPPDGFNPLTADPADRERYGIPARPDEQALPHQAAFWDEMFRPPLTFTAAPFTLLSTPLRISELLRMTTSGNRESSLNWSGAYITPSGRRRLSAIQGHWRVPDVDLPAGTTGDPELRSSTWIGLDGQRRYFDSTLPQIGTAQFFQPSVGPTFLVWWQWWMRDNPNTYVPGIIPLPIADGHQIMATLTVVNETSVHFVIENRTTNVAYRPFTMDAPKDPVSGRRAKVTGGSAEWIVERPADVLPNYYDLPDYHEVEFEDCYATASRFPSGGVPSAGREQSLVGARLISMYTTARDPSRRVTISRPDRPDGDRFFVRYVNH